MPSAPPSPASRKRVLQVAAMFVAGTAAAYWLAPTDPVPPQRQVAATPVAAPLRSDAVREEIQSLLAQGGCPGWITLAQEPELLAEARSVAPTGKWRETAARQSDVPRVTYPTPVHVVGPPQELPAPEDGPLLLAQLPPVEDDELISEADDLLTTSPEVTGKPAAKPEAPVPAPQPAPQAAQDADDEALIDRADDLLAPDVNDEANTAGEATDKPADKATDKPADEAPPPPTATETPEQMPAPTTQPTKPAIEAPPLPPARAVPGVAAPHSTGAGAKGEAKKKADEESRCEFIAKSLYPAATECRVCHEKIYDEWSVSSHAYSAVSPMFHKFEQKINDLSNGTIGYFCYRCHSPAGTSLGVSRAAPLWDLPQVAREGVTCVACHRINEMYGKTNGERRIEPGDIYAPVYGTIGGDGVAMAIANKDQFKVKTSPAETGPGQPIHGAGFSFPQLAHSEFCTSCHQVAVYPGIKLEVVWEQYRASPACKKGISCQDCHMGRIPGLPSGYECGPAAVVNNKNVNPNRKHGNHVFYGPGYSIAHPGIFPWNPKALRWSMRDWLLFDWRAGWGTDDFEDAVHDGKIVVQFPEVWKESDDRCDAREVLDDNLKKRRHKDELRAQVMENGSRVEGPFFESQPCAGQELRFNYVVANTNEGHNLPTASLGAQPQLWANVALVGPRGNRLWETGYLDCLTDLADIHSEEVRNKRLAYDWQLFNLQTMFLITGAKGTDREFFLPVNIDIDPLAFIRPAPQPVSVINHPPFIRMEARSLAPLGARTVPYKVPADLLREPGRYRLSFRMRSRTEPPYFMRFCGSTVEMIRAMNEGILDFHQMSFEFEVR